VISVSDLKLSFGERVLFKEVNLKFTPGNCYGIIGANGAGKSTFLKILSGEIEQDSGEVSIGPGQRVAVLKQDQFAYEEHIALDVVIMGHPKLYSVMKEREAIYAKENFTDEDGVRASELEAEFAELGGWEAESEAGQLLSGLGLEEAYQGKLMGELDGGQKVRVLLAQALFGNPGVLLLDEPTNGLDLESIAWLEEFLIDFQNTLIVVSHDRHFLNAVCTHICDIDYGHIRMYAGNYDYWHQASQIAQRQQKDMQKKREDKINDLKAFIQRFSSNASKSRQATSRKKVLEKLTVDNFPSSSRRFPYVGFKPDREVGNNVLTVQGLSASFEGKTILSGFDLTVDKGDKIAFVGTEHQAKTALFSIIAGEAEPEAGSYQWGQTITTSYFPKDNSAIFASDLSITDWLRQYSPQQDDTYVRSFLGRMLFSGEEALKPVNVLSGGEKVRCLLSKMMLSAANVLILDEPTAHLDLESITALNDGLIEFPGVILFNSHDHEFVNSIANRIIEICPRGVIDKRMAFDDYIKDDSVRALRDQFYEGHHHRADI
jgi:ATPase subunit of ABC transporter with duplicated ATPase domains